MDKLKNIKELAASIFKKFLNILTYIGIVFISFFTGALILSTIRYPNAVSLTNTANKDIESVKSEYTELNENIDTLKSDIELLEKEKDDKNNKINELEQILNSYN